MNELISSGAISEFCAGATLGFALYFASQGLRGWALCSLLISGANAVVAAWIVL